MYPSSDYGLDYDGHSYFHRAEQRLKSAHEREIIAKTNVNRRVHEDMPASLKLRLSGPFAAETADGTALDIPLRGQALLAYLVEGKRCSATRSELATLIWPDREDAQARASLRQELSALRRVLPDGVLKADRASVSIALDRVEILLPEDTRPFLDGMALRSEPFEDWLRSARARDTAQRVSTCLDTARDAMGNDPDRAADNARMAHTLDPSSEPAIRLLMSAEAARDNRSAALSAYEAFRGWLADELGAEPEGETRNLAEAIRTGAQIPTASRMVPETASGNPTLAVLAFDELGAPQDDMFADGVVEEITGALSRIREFDVIARQSAFVLRGKGLGHREIAERLGVDYLVEGSVRRSGDRVRIAVQLVSGGEGRTLWSERFDDRMDDLFDLQDRIAAQVAGQIAPSLRFAEIARADRRPPEDRTAYETVLTALPHFWSHRKASNSKAIALFDEALKRDPNYVPALAYKAWAMCQLPSYMWSDDPGADHARALELADAAAPLAGDHAPTLVAISAAYSMSGNDPERARHYAERALAIDPNNAWGRMRRAYAFHYMGAQEEALREFDEAERLSPLDPFHFNFHFGRGAAYRQMGDYDAAIRELNLGMQENPNVKWGYRVLVGTFALAGRHSEAREAARTFHRHYPHITLQYMWACMPPAIRDRQSIYTAAFRDIFSEVGIPEE